MGQCKPGLEVRTESECQFACFCLEAKTNGTPNKKTDRPTGCFMNIDENDQWVGNCHWNVNKAAVHTAQKDPTAQNDRAVCVSTTIP